jgi:DNA-binding transcriptional LysR family regulator
MDRLAAMSILLRVVEKGSFSAASRELRMPLATVSRKVSELESHLGTRLLIRTTRKLAMTDAGAAYVTSAKRILEATDEAERAAAGEYSKPRGELIVTAPVLFGRLHVLPVVADFLAAYPDIDVRLLLSDRNLHLVDDHFDMAARIGALPDSSMVATSLGAMRTITCASPKLLAAHATPLSPHGLAQSPCVNFDFRSRASTWRFRQKDSKEVIEIPIRSRLSVSTAEAAVWAAIQSIGIVRVLHYQCANALREGSLRIILPDFELAPLPVHLIHVGGATLPLKTRAFLDFAAPRLRRRLNEVARAGG